MLPPTLMSKEVKGYVMFLGAGSVAEWGRERERHTHTQLVAEQSEGVCDVLRVAVMRERETHTHTHSWLMSRSEGVRDVVRSWVGR